uniref:Large ribosomal subunit protein uL18c n=1 Tax=Osmundaria fimbriata TaxID=228265 RepID=A0A1Z1M543_OSMFI|nr:ribosomal protein L18 [Osmundaria fimbriata]ARW60884.1 ribosomal protein L18 [Osmundaria fimbriata]
MNNKVKRPRLYIFKSNKHLYAHIIDDDKKQIITSSSTTSRELNNKYRVFRNSTTAKAIGKSIALKLKKMGIKQIIFDRGRNIYHGQIKILADAARAEGIIF